jgi:uncharacterized protein (TIGR02646 family)
MRQIRKLQPPTSLIQFRATLRSTPGRTFDDYDDKQTLRGQLVQEQRGLCCFCLCRIRTGEPGMLPPMKIAHWHSRSLHEDEWLDYSNLLGACMGNQGKDHDPRIQHCDTRQGERDIKWNPANPDHRIEDKIRYLPDGTIISEDTEFSEQINEVLNLNVDFLVRSRKYVLDSFQVSLGKRGLTPREWEKMLQEWNGETNDGELNEYCQIVVFWLRKRLARI